MTAPHSPTRREFLHSAAAAGLVGLTDLSPARAASIGPRPAPAKNCIFINLVGGPSHLDTFDPKPTAPADDRGPFRPIQTRVPGLHLSELFPKMAGLADRFSLLRGMHHTAPPVHEAGFQLLNAGRLFRDGPEWPSVGAVMSYLNRDKHLYFSDWLVYPDDRLDTGINVSHGQGLGFLNSYECLRPQFVNDDLPSDWNPGFSTLCELALGQIADNARINLYSMMATINMFSTVFDAPSWDCHADRGSLATTLNDNRATVAPEFDSVFTTLLTDLESRGLLESTLVIATGEFGRTPWLNCNGGRDHWAGAWTALVAGGGVKGGRVIGATDRRGAEVVERPTTPQELVSTVFHALGVPEEATIPGPEGKPVAVYPGLPITELF